MGGDSSILVITKMVKGFVMARIDMVDIITQESLSVMVLSRRVGAHSQSSVMTTCGRVFHSVSKKGRIGRFGNPEQIAIGKVYPSFVLINCPPPSSLINL